MASSYAWSYSEIEPVVQASPDAEADALRVLFIGKDPALADLYRIKLALDGYRTELDEAPRTRPLRTGHVPDVIYLDLTTAPRWGRTVLRHIRQDPTTKTTPVVLLVVRPIRRLSLGRHDFLVKLGTPSPTSQRRGPS